MRLTKLHSGSWEEKAASMKKVRSDYENMQRRLQIATKRIEMMSAEVSKCVRELSLKPLGAFGPLSVEVAAQLGIYFTLTRPDQA